MKVIKNYFWVLFLLFTALFITGCSRDNPAPPPDGPQANGNGPAEPAGLRIAMVTSPNVAQDGAFNENNYNGVMDFIRNNPGSTIELVHDPDIARAIETAYNAASDYDVIVTPGFQFSRITQAALDNPETKFILMDIYPVDEDGQVVEVDNIYAVQFREQDGGFLAGVTAALETKTGIVALLGGMATSPANVNYQFGFEAGVHYANKHLGTDAVLASIPAYAGVDAAGVNVGGTYVGSFNDASLCRLLADALMDEGADIIFVFAGNASHGAYAAAIDREGALIIGAGTDQRALDLGHERNVGLTSIMKLMGINVMRALEAVRDGTFAGGNFRLGIDTDSIGYITTPGLHQLSQETINQLEALIVLMKNGDIVPPSAASGSPNNFPGL